MYSHYFSFSLSTSSERKYRERSESEVRREGWGMNAATEMRRQDKEIATGDYVAAELNLESIGYFSAGYKRKYPTEMQRSKVVTLNRERRIEIIPNLKYGFPNSEDQDFYRAFLKICDERVILTTRKKE